MKYDIVGDGLFVVTVEAKSREEAKKIAEEKFGDINSYKIDQDNCINICTEIKFRD